MSNDRNDNRNNNRRGAGRRTYPQSGGPRVGRVATNVPRAEKVGEDGASIDRQDRRAGSYAPRRQPGRYNPGGAQREDRRYGRPQEDSQPRRYGQRREDDRPERRGYDRSEPARRDEGRSPHGFKANPHRREEDPARRISMPEYDDGPRYDRDERPHHGAAWRSESGPKRRYAGEPTPAPEDLPEDAERVLAGRNPIREALRAGRPVEKLLIAQGDLSGAAREIIRLAKDANVVVQQVERSRLDQIAPNHQGMLAYVAAVPYVELSAILDGAKAKGEDPFLILLDGVTDPHNLGAIIRSAECAGAHGVVIPERRASGLTPVVAKAAAGALNHMPIARVNNLNRAIEALKEAGVWVIGTAMDGEDALSADLTGPIALVIGSEGEGISRLTLEKCDRTVTLPMKGHIESLNASVAAGILMYEVLRARAK